MSYNIYEGKTLEFRAGIPKGLSLNECMDERVDVYRGRADVMDCSEAADSQERGAHGIKGSGATPQS